MIAIIKYVIIFIGICVAVVAGLILAFDGDVEKLKSKLGKGKSIAKNKMGKQNDKTNDKKNKKTNKKSEKNKGKDRIKIIESQELLDFEDIKEINPNEPVGLIVRSNKREYIGVIEVFGLNYNLLAIEEREILEDSFSKLLNGIDYPIEITIQSRRLDIDKFLQKYGMRLEEIHKIIQKYETKIKFISNQNKPNKDEIIVLEEKKARIEKQLNYGIKLNEWITEVCKDKNMLDRKYYISVSHKHDPSKFKEELTYDEISANAYFDISNKCNSIIGALKRARLNGRLLDGMNVAELLYISFNKADSNTYKIKNAIKSNFSHYVTTAEPVELKAIKRRVEELKIKEEEIKKSIENLENEGLENEELEELTEKVGA